MFTVEYCGYNTHNKDCDVIYRPNGSSSYLFLIILSPMYFYFDEQEVLAKPGACILYPPDTLQHYQAEKKFINSYIHFCSDEPFLSQYSFPLNQLFYPEHTDEMNWLMKKIQIEFLTKAPHYENEIHALITQLLICLDRSCLHNLQEPFTTSHLLPVFQALRIQILTSCEENWTLERMCQIVNLGKSQLYYYYKYFFHSSPKTELINARIDKAKHLLTNEALQINQVAQDSGFINIYHFTRYFKSTCGCTPSEFRKQNKH